ncbi:hypothetical protein AWH56_023010 [Anaerobacillus isosaccharinicus]|uniref:Peptidase MA-like domain-containing protein n=1 Tax=Anaerobacillus isosaccharinicus TaxID=1532552 RepID=A0A1S2LLU4_9BACI|nr:hypothetical protein [Anaerobacillus isosaccharinicus]MBA5586226.1 hypothetical protein [Anaerobacillus isosaccharinicus]QOY35518.1 hypothetical protein AWH56_023010 [Anaerobacillus isosaccharinicus]
MQNKWYYVILIVVLLVVIQIYPMLNVHTNEMVREETGNFILYFEEVDRAVASEIGELLNTKRGGINHKLSFEGTEMTEVYIYPDQNTLHGKKYGMIGRLIGPKWYIGDNIGKKVLLVSPNNPGPEHSSESVVTAVVHEYVHTVVYQINRKTPKWIDEGLAVYLAGQKPMADSISKNPVPSFKKVKTNNPITFGNIGGYEYSYTYMRFIDSQFGLEAVGQFLRNELDYEAAFGYTEEELYDMWLVYLEKVY